MEKKNLQMEIENRIAGLEDYAKVALFNSYCDAVNDTDSALCEMDMLDECLCGQSPTWILERGYYGDFCPADDYFYFNGYGNLESVNEWEIDRLMYASDIADYCVRNWESLGCEEIREALDEWEKMEEEEEE